MKNYFVLLLLAIMAVSCGPYQSALKSTDNEVKLAMIDTLLKKEKYGKAVNLFDQIIPQYRGTDKAEELSIKYAKALYESGDYLNSSYQYERFVQSHPASEDREYAAYMGAKSHYKMSSIYSKSQVNTDRALAKLQDYINTFPNGKHADEANGLVSELRYKLDRKAYEIAKNYHHRNRFIPAVKSFENFIIQHPGSEFMDDAQFYLLDSQFLYAMKSRDELIPERLESATKYYNTFVSRFPTSEYREEADEIMEKITEYKSDNNI
ncbi:MAG: outer membrane protein assembly factor BamD [Nonlabens sp.]|uniref:outer membrane protein assembly factor BamD n=1 Tax=Nonlabens sp. TaxID=1888209 RepID=UPI003EF46F9D